jgi:two-component system LytT family response regulator
MTGEGKLTAVIVEDLAPALDALRKDLADCCPEVEVIGTAGGVVEGAKLLRQCSPDLLFLDIMLGDGTAFDLLEILPDLTARLIFVTASEEFALRAFRFAAVDYLLKPVTGDQLRGAVDRAAALSGPADPERLQILQENLRSPTRLPDRISLHTADRIQIVAIRDIIRCEADDNNTRFVLTDQRTIFVTKTLKHFERLLSEHEFLRVHQSHLVNLRHVLEFRKTDSGYLHMSNEEEVPVASRKRSAVVAAL